MKLSTTTIIGILLLLTALPLASATGATLFDTAIYQGSTATFTTAQQTRNVAVTTFDLTQLRCRIAIDDDDLGWMNIGEEQTINGVVVEVKDIDTTEGCRVKIRDDDTTIKPSVSITSITLPSITPDKYGYHYAENFGKVTFEITVQSKTAIKNVPYIFYNNGYPTGEGATDANKGSINLNAGTTTITESMPFTFEDDTLYNTGSFLTVFILDPQATVLAQKAYIGQTVYAKKLVEEYVTTCGDTYCSYPETAATCPQDCASPDEPTAPHPSTTGVIYDSPTPAYKKENFETSVYTPPPPTSPEQREQEQYERSRDDEVTCDTGCYVANANRCFTYGTRLVYNDVASYCALTGELQLQKRDNEPAQNNYECQSNSARYNVCEPVAEQTNIIKKMFSWFSNIFDG